MVGNEYLLLIQLKDISKAVRITIEYAKSDKNETKKIYTEKICKTCGTKKNKKALCVELYPEQKEFLDRAAKDFSLQSVDVSCKNFTSSMIS